MPCTFVGYIEHSHRPGNKVLLVHSLEMPSVPSRDSKFVIFESQHCSLVVSYFCHYNYFLDTPRYIILCKMSVYRRTEFISRQVQ